MLEGFWFKCVSRKKRTFGEALFFAFLVIISVFYSAGLLIRKLLYYAKIIKPKRFNSRIICAGNMTVGGTGKTPFIEEMARRLIREEKSVLIVCKGYRREKTKAVDIVSDGAKILLKQKNAGDEAYMLARAVPRAKVLVADNKLKGIQAGIDAFKPDYVLLDDGFQKRGDIADAMHVVLVDAINPAGFNRLFPAGMLREPFSEIKNADAVLLTNVNLVAPEKAERLKEAILRFNKNLKVFESEHQPKIVYNISTGEKFDTGFLNEKKAIVFSSIGNPLGFERTLKNLGLHILVGLRFKDHHRLYKHEMEAVMKLYEATKAQLIVTTEKDEVKLIKKHIIDNRIFALKIGLFIRNAKELEKRLKISQ
jgi:tetraacyldisaccharide 4'-kinase